MFTRTEEFTVGNFYFADFMRLLGRVGVKFDVSDEYYTVDRVDPKRKHYYRTITVRASRKKLSELYEAGSILMGYQVK